VNKRLSLPRRHGDEERAEAVIFVGNFLLVMSATSANHALVRLDPVTQKRNDLFLIIFRKEKKYFVFDFCARTSSHDATSRALSCSFLHSHGCAASHAALIYTPPSLIFIFTIFFHRF
jgi:hypothetical protein